MSAAQQPDPERWTVVASEAVLDNPWFAVRKSEVRTPVGTQLTYWSVDHHRVGVGVVPRRADQILLVHQHRFLVDRHVWAIPSGGAERSENPADAAARELLEETGHGAATLTELIRYFPSYGAGNQEFILFEARVADTAPTGFDRNEVIERRWFPQAEVRRMALAGEIVDGLSLVPLLLLATREGW
jgi:8-oxo-dGTP pyrophosphatase MutT (NUDIX family)